MFLNKIPDSFNFGPKPCTGSDNKHHAIHRPESGLNLKGIIADSRCINNIDILSPAIRTDREPN